MKKWLLALALCVACGKNDPQGLNRWMSDNGKVKVLSTIAMIGDLVEQVGGEQIDHLVLIRGETDPHSYELVKGDAEKFARADIVFSNGLGLEHGASIQYQLKEHPGSVPIGDHLYRQHREELLVIDAVMDCHVWMDVSLWAKAVDPIVATLSEKMPEYAAVFKHRGNRLKKHLTQVHEELYTKMQAVPEEKRYLVTSHDAFNYFARRYMAEPGEVMSYGWKKRVAAPEGLSPDGQLGPLDIQKITAHLERYQISFVFPESNVSRAALNKVVDTCSKRGREVRIIDEPLYGDAMGDSYEGMMRHNVETIAGALNKPHS